MKRLLLGLGVAAAMLCAASSAFAVGGVNISWSTCFGENPSASRNRTFACASNAGTNLLVTSFVLDTLQLGAVSGTETVVDILSATDPVPLWWQFRDIGTCRQTALGSNSIADANNLVCVDWAQGQSAGGVGAYTSDPGNGWTIDPSVTLGQHRRLKLAFAVPLAGLQDLTQASEYFSANISINNTKTVGTGACTGCNEPICIVLNSIKVTTNTGAGNRTISGGAAAGSDIVTWQGVGPNCQLVPTKNVTWGSVKALYR